MTITLNGTTGITTPAASSTGASTFAGSLALPSGGLTVGTDQLVVDSVGRVTMPYQPVFSAKRTAGNVSSGVVLWDSIAVNIGNCYSSSTGRFTAPITGLYYFGANGIVGTGVTGTGCNGSLSLRKNGSPVKDSHWNMSDAWENVSITSIIQLSQNDYVDYYITPADGAPYLYGSSSYSNACGYLIG